MTNNNETNSVSESTTIEPVNNPATPVPADTQDNDHETGTETDNASMENEENRDLRVVCTVSHRVYQAPSCFHKVDVLDDV